MHNGKVFRKNLWYLVGATRGGPMRAKIIQELCNKPMNPNQLSSNLNVDYKTVTHHLNVLRKNGWVVSGKEKYAELFFPTFTEDQKTIFLNFLEEIGKKN